MAAPKGNSNAKKLTGKKDTHLHIKLTKEEKGRLIIAARPHKLSTYVRRKLGLEDNPNQPES